MIVTRDDGLKPMSGSFCSRMFSIPETRRKSHEMDGPPRIRPPIQLGESANGSKRNACFFR
jgi:hypothetical protein